MITSINEFKQYLNENVSSINIITDKDWDRMLNLFLTGKDGEGVANTIKDKNKAIARFIAGLKLSNNSLEYDERWKNYNGYFSDFGNKALKLGATPEEIQSIFDSTEIPQKYLDKKGDLGSKKYNDRFVGSISKAIIDAGFDIKFLNKGGNALTLAGKEAMSRSGRKWTIGYKSQIIVNGQAYDFNFDAITDEGDGPTSYVVELSSSDNIFIRFGNWNILGKNKFISDLITILKNV